MKTNNLLPIIILLGVLALFFFPSPEEHIIIYLGVMLIFVVLVIFLLIKWGNKRIFKTKKLKNKRRWVPMKMKKKFKKKDMKYCSPGSRSCGGCFYFLGFLGSAIYYVSTATGFWMGVLGILKSLVWPAFLVFELLKFLGA